MHRNNKNFHTSGKISCEHFEQEKCIYQGPGRLRNSMNANNDRNYFKKTQKSINDTVYQLDM